METIQLGDLSAELDRSNPDTLSVRLSGRSASREAGQTLAPLFDRVLDESARRARGLSLHFEYLDYFNSSTIAALVQFIRTAHERGIALTVVYDGKQRWQAMSFDALRRALRPFASATGPSVHFRDLSAQSG